MMRDKTTQEKTQEKSIEIYRKKIIGLTENIDNDFLLGYSEAILNLLGEFTNGQCADCSFSYEVECYSPDFIYPEYDLRCRLNECWIDTIKNLLGKETTCQTTQKYTMSQKERGLPKRKRKRNS